MITERDVVEFFAKRAGSAMAAAMHRDLCMMHLGFIIVGWPPLAIVMAGEEE